MTNTDQLIADLKQLPVSEILDRYNALAADAGRPTLRVWKGPKDTLINRFMTMKAEAQKVFDAKVAEEEARVRAEKTTVVDPAPAKGAASQPHTKRALRGEPNVLTKKARKAQEAGDLDAHPLVQEENVRRPKEKASKAAKKNAAVANRAQKASGDVTTLADLAREQNVNPKVYRAKARRKAKDLKPYLIGDSWSFKTTDKAAVLKVLKGA